MREQSQRRLPLDFARARTASAESATPVALEPGLGFAGAACAAGAAVLQRPGAERLAVGSMGRLQIQERDQTSSGR